MAACISWNGKNLQGRYKRDQIRVLQNLYPITPILAGRHNCELSASLRWLRVWFSAMANLVE